MAALAIEQHPVRLHAAVFADAVQEVVRRVGLVKEGGMLC